MRHLRLGIYTFREFLLLDLVRAILRQFDMKTPFRRLVAKHFLEIEGKAVPGTVVVPCHEMAWPEIHLYYLEGPISTPDRVNEHFKMIDALIVLLNIKKEVYPLLGRSRKAYRLSFLARASELFEKSRIVLLHDVEQTPDDEVEINEVRTALGLDMMPLYEISLRDGRGLRSLLEHLIRQIVEENDTGKMR